MLLKSLPEGRERLFWEMGWSYPLLCRKAKSSLMHSCWYALSEIGRGSVIVGVLLGIRDCRGIPPMPLRRRPELIAADTLRFESRAVDAGVDGRMFSRPTRGIMEALPRGGRDFTAL